MRSFITHVWGGLIHRRLVAGRQFALKKLDQVAPRHPSRTLTHHEHYYRQQESRQKINNRLSKEMVSLENLDKFVPGQNARSNVLQILSFPTSQLWHPSCSLTPQVNTSSRWCPHVTTPSCAVFIVVVRSSPKCKIGQTC